MSAFPIVKLTSLAVKQMSKPLANVIKNRAKSSPFFKTYVCMPPAQIYHWIEINVKMKMLNVKKKSEIQKLNETMAIELGAELLGEFIIFSIAALTLTLEFMRQARKADKELQAIEERWERIESRVDGFQQRFDECLNDLDTLLKTSQRIQERQRKLKNDTDNSGEQKKS